MKIYRSFVLLLVISTNIYAYKISLTKTSNNGWVLLDESNTPFVVQGICYAPTPIGETEWNYNFFDDENAPWFTDGDYMERMGVNTVRIYKTGKDSEVARRFIRQMYKIYSIYTIFPVPLNMNGADFASKKWKNLTKKKILNTVKLYKDTPGILVWLIGNEVDYFFYDDKAFWETPEMKNITAPYKRAKIRAKIVFKFINEIAKEIKKIDHHNHPVGISLGKTEFFNLLKDKKIIPDVDFLGLNYYQARTFSSVWGLTKKTGKPILITEFGYDAYNTKKALEDELMQSKFILSLWKDIASHSYKGKKRQLCLGGSIFEFSDEWWKYDYGEPEKHDTEGSWANAAWPDFTPDKPNNVQEEWFGIFKLEKRTNNIDKRIPRDIYYKLRDIWNSESE